MSETPKAPKAPPKASRDEVPPDASEAPPPSEPVVTSYETDEEGVYSATEGGVPDPTVQAGSGTVTDPIPGASQAGPAPEGKPRQETKE